jgi:hypothetical protein
MRLPDSLDLGPDPGAYVEACVSIVQSRPDLQHVAVGLTPIIRALRPVGRPRKRSP